MPDQISSSEKRLHHEIEPFIKEGKIEILDDKDLPPNHDFIVTDFFWRSDFIRWEVVPTSEHYQVKIPDKPEESRDFTIRMIEKYNLKGPVILYGDALLDNTYRLDISLLPSVVWDFMPLPLCLYAVNPQEKWCFTYNMYKHLNFGYAPEIASQK